MTRDILFPLRQLHGMLYEWYIRQKRKAELLKKPHLQEYMEKKSRCPDVVFLVLTPEHANLGDHAIAYAEAEMLKKAGIDYVEITGKTFFPPTLDILKGRERTSVRFTSALFIPLGRFTFTLEMSQM